MTKEEDLIEAAKEGKLDIVQKLLKSRKRPNINFQDQEGWTALNYACKSGHTPVAIALIEAGADATPKNHKGLGSVVGKAVEKHGTGETALHMAARYERKEVLQMLLERKAVNVNITNNEGHTPLHYAAYKGRKAATEMLIKAGADVKAVDSQGWNPFHSCARGGSFGTGKILFQAGCDFRAVDNDGWTTLHVAADYGNPEIANLLLRIGVKHDAVTNNGATAYELAEQYGYDEVLDLIWKYEKEKLDWQIARKARKAKAAMEAKAKGEKGE